MTNLAKLNVSLTKHGAHKIALLLRDFDKDHILENVEGKVEGINIELAQARKNLSVSGGVVPDLWNEVRSLSNDAIDALVFIAIVFSHTSLISAMRNSTEKKLFQGTITRDKQLAGKAYTNFAHTVHELGFSAERGYGDRIRFDLERIFEVKGLHPLAARLIGLKLASAGWDKKNSVIEESLVLGFEEVFSVPADELSNWLSTGSRSAGGSAEFSTKDIEFFSDTGATSIAKEFVFAPGHNVKKTGTVNVAPSKGTGSADLLHNEIQNKLYAYLVNIFGKQSVSTEAPTGDGTSIDVVVKTGTVCWFYEIKTADTVKACIRQAIPQLLEYAYWRGQKNRATKLIIVSPLPVTKDAERYLAFLTAAFGLPLVYEQFDPKNH